MLTFLAGLDLNLESADFGIFSKKNKRWAHEKISFYRIIWLTPSMFFWLLRSFTAFAWNEKRDLRSVITTFGHTFN